MDSIYKSILFLLFLAFGIHPVAGQQLSLGVRDFLGTGLSNDLGMECQYNHPLGKNNIVFGAELRSVDWGNHLGLMIGFKARYFQHKSILIGGSTMLHPGLALFRQGSIGSFGLSYAPYAMWQSKKRLFLEIDLGIRYMISPAYKSYGKNQQLEFPVGLNLGFWLGKMEESTP